MKKGQKLPQGTHFIMGNMALAEGIIAAGCNFVSGYPITPSSEIVNRLAITLPTVGGGFLQTEDEISAVCSAIGASWAGCKAMTATSGPGISLMQENIGYAVATETPLVIVDVQRLGPSTGAPSVGVCGDIIQVAHGSHGDYQIIAICPESPQEMFDMSIRAFNLAETYRCPVFILSDGFIGHMREQVVIPETDKISLVSRKISAAGTDQMSRTDFLDANVARMPVLGHGFKAHVTGSSHDKNGMRNLVDPQVMHDFVSNPIKKILNHRDEIIEIESDFQTGDTLLVTYGTVSRSAKAAIALGRSQGLSIGLLRLKTIWPFASTEIEAISRRVNRMIVLENNTGQLFPYIKADAAAACQVDFLGPQLLGQIHDPEYILNFIKETN